jgi:hypothetical protein
VFDLILEKRRQVAFAGASGDGGLPGQPERPFTGAGRKIEGIQRINLMGVTR